MDISKYYTPHINATPDDFAKTVLMPGDPKRAEFIAKNFLEKASLINDVRGIKGYTGEYNGTRVSVMASGMGMPSIGIYSYELFNFFGVENIIRVGSIGSLQTNVKIHDIVIAMGASTTSSFGEQYGLSGKLAPLASWELLSSAVEEAEKRGVTYHVGNILSSGIFYNVDPDFNKKWADMGILGIEMEAAALYMNAAYSKKRALAICTVSDEIFTGIATTSEERESSFTEMMTIALNLAVKAEK